MITKKEREGRERVIVVLDAIKASMEKKNGVAPLRFALRDAVGPKDEVLVLVILNSEADASPSNAGCCCMGDERLDHYPSEGDSYIEFLHEEISQRKEAYRQIFRPYYDRCKSSGVKFQVKVVAGFEPKALVVEEANNVNATWIVMDRCFASDQSFQLSGTYCNMTLVSSDGDTATHKNLPLKDEAETSKSSKPYKELVSPEQSYVHHASPNFENEYRSILPYLASTSREAENLTMFESSNESKRQRKGELSADGSFPDDDSISSTGFSQVNLVVRMPLELSWPAVEEITGGFTRMTCINKNESFKTYCGYLSDHHSQVLVKLFAGEFDCIIEAEKKAALSMYHKNIMGLVGYHKSINGTVLVYPFTKRWTLDRFLHGSKGKQFKLTFQEKMKIAIGIGQGVRYIHEECPRGPIVHGDLRPCNIFLNSELEPQITGFGQATWLQLKQGLTISSNRFWHKDPSDLESLASVKSDILHFGILLLRLFCKRSALQDDKIFLQWARPLLLQRAYHKLLEEDMEYLDMYAILRVMCVAAQCIKTKPVSRPSMSEVISLLRGETSCALQLSPSSEGSPNVDLRMSLSA